MEKISSDMKVSELKQGSLCKAYEKLSSEATAILMFSLQWKDLDEHFNSTRSSLEHMLGELDERERNLEAREKLVAKNSVLDSEIESKSKCLADMETLIEEGREELEREKKRLDEMNRSSKERGTEIERQNQEFDSKSKRLDEIDRLINERGKELEVNNRDVELLDSAIRMKQRELDNKEKWIKEKVRDFDQLKTDIKERTKTLDSLERCVRQRFEEAESTGKELALVVGMLKKCRGDYESVRKSLEDHEDMLRVSRNYVNVLDGEIRLRGEVLCSIQELIGKCSVELESTKSHLDSARKEFELKKRMFVALKNSVDQYSRGFDGNVKRLEGLMQKVHEVNQESFGPEFGEIHSIHDKVNECLNQVEMKEKSLVSFKKLVEERGVELEKREAQLKERFDEFVLIQKELDSTLNSTDFGAKEKTFTLCTKVKIEPSDNNVANLPSFASYQYCTTNGHFLQLLLTEQLKRHDARCNELFAVLHGSPDPAKLVLDAVQGFYPLHSSGKYSHVDLNVVRSSCIFLLEKLKVISPEISPRVREEARKLASDWKDRMVIRIENHLEVLGFFQLRDSYRLHSDFAGDEIRRFVELNQKIRQAFPFEIAHCPADEAPDTTNQAENMTDVVSSCPNLIGKDLTQDDILTAIQMPDPAKHVLGMVEGSFSLLWKRGEQVGSEPSFIKSYMFIFEQILRNTPEVKDDVRRDAMKLAKEWRERIRANNMENHLEASGFLLFVAAYGLVASFHADDIAYFLEIISRDSHALEQSQNLGLGYDLEAYIQNLIGKKKRVEAVRLISAFKLTDKFSPVKLLNEHTEEAKTHTRRLCKRKKSVEEKDKATDLEITSLRAVVQCIKDHNLESDFCSDNIMKRIGLLEKIKMDRRNAAEFFQGTDELQQQLIICSKRKNSNMSSDDQQKNQLKQSQNKRPKKKNLVTTVETCNSPVPKPVPELGQNSSADDHQPDGKSPQLDPNGETDMPV